MAEGVIVLPVFILILAAILHFHRAYSKKLALNEEARACAWKYAVDGCKSSALEKQCKVTRGEVEALGAIQGNQANSAMSEMAEAAGTMSKIGGRVIGLTEPFTTHADGESVRASLLGGGTMKLRSRYTLMCNERGGTPASMLHKWLCGISQGKMLSCDASDFKKEDPK